jgi:hypothetical protein
MLLCAYALLTFSRPSLFALVRLCSYALIYYGTFAHLKFPLQNVKNYRFSVGLPKNVIY